MARLKGQENAQRGRADARPGSRDWCALTRVSVLGVNSMSASTASAASTVSAVSTASAAPSASAATAAARSGDCSGGDGSSIGAPGHPCRYHHRRRRGNFAAPAAARLVDPRLAGLCQVAHNLASAHPFFAGLAGLADIAPSAADERAAPQASQAGRDINNPMHPLKATYAARASSSPFRAPSLALREREREERAPRRLTTCSGASGDRSRLIRQTSKDVALLLVRCHRV
jgi:hypothetical protein